MESTEIIHVATYSPYKDPLMITAQALAIAAFLLSWTYYISWLVALIPLVLQQIVWCCRYNKTLLIIDGVVCLIVGGFFIYVGVEFWRWTEEAQMCVSYAAAVLWVASGVFTLGFVASGRHAKWEAKWTESLVDTDADVVVVAVEEVEEGTATPTPVMIK